MNYLEITAEDIKRLDDTELRELIGLLCEADYRLAGLSTHGINWSGHQTAADGGLDVSVRSDENPPKNSFLARRITGIQVKISDMSRSKIIEEMRPENKLRPDIRNLIEEGGSYIIVSSGNSTAPPALKRRLQAMKDAIAEESNHQNFHMDFFDSGKVANWVRNHFGLILLVHGKIGRGSKGWSRYENWSNPPGGIKEEYILDNGLRLIDETQRTTNKEESIQSGIQNLRSKLAIPGNSVRLIGLSGVGKTRLAQALFDKAVGKDALSQDLAIYTDSDNPEPDPLTLANILIAGKRKAVLIIDNCDSKLHSKLTEICKVTNSTISLLTIEYDIKDDLPNETNVVKLEPASLELIENLIKKRFSYISSVDARTISVFSGGNARVAISLANTVKNFETLAGLRDDQLFQRLFMQRNHTSEDLLKSAMACSLLYSFNAEDAYSDKSELRLLATLIGKSADDLCYDINQLKKRGLVQVRGKWKAILPPAIANRLAKWALEAFSKDKIVKAFFHNDSERLAKSFTRRLSNLHDSKEAVQIVNEFLEKDNWIVNLISNPNDFCMDILRNVAPVSPDKILEAIERSLGSMADGQFNLSQNNFYIFIRILKNIAFDADFFKRIAEIMLRLAFINHLEENRSSICEMLKSLFFINFSGTMATIEMRAEFIERLLNSKNIRDQKIALKLLDATLKIPHFPPITEFDFGARPRSFGYTPPSIEEAIKWYETFIRICTQIIIDQEDIAIEAKKILVDNFFDLTQSPAFDFLENRITKILEQGVWHDGWTAIRDLISTFGISEQLLKLEKLLRPNSFTDRVRAYLTSNKYLMLCPDGDIENKEGPPTHKSAEVIAQEIGVKIVQNPDVLNDLLPEIVSLSCPQLFYVGLGLAEGALDRKKLWTMLRDQFLSTPFKTREIGAIEGFLFSCSNLDPELCQLILDTTFADEILTEYFPNLQMVVPFDQIGLKRLHQALDIGRVNINIFRSLSKERNLPTDDDLAGLLDKIRLKQNGLALVLEILSAMFNRKSNKKTFSKQLLLVAQKALLSFPVSGIKQLNNNYCYQLNLVAEICLENDESSEFANIFCKTIIQAIVNGSIYVYDYSTILAVIAQLHPICFLNNFLIENLQDNHTVNRLIYNLSEEKNPFNKISDETILAWCDEDSARRYLLIAKVISPHELSENGELKWRTIIYSLFRKTPSLDLLLDNIADNLFPGCWSGSAVSIFQGRLALIQQLYQHENHKIRKWAQCQYAKIKILYDNELKQSRERLEYNTSFE